MSRYRTFLCCGLLLSGLVPAQNVLYTTGAWDSDKLGNHRAVVEVTEPSDAVWVHIPWRRRDAAPEKKNIIVVDGTTGDRIDNVARPHISREVGEIVFQPRSGPGSYYIYYLPYVTSGRRNYPTITYPQPEETADADWLRRHGLREGDPSWSELPQARLVVLQSLDDLDSFWPMEVTATREELDVLRSRYPDARFLVFPEDRKYPIRMDADLPLRWIEYGPNRSLGGEAQRGEFYAFQIGVYAIRQSIEKLDVTVTALIQKDGAGRIEADRTRCFNLGGIDWLGRAFTKTVSVEEGKVQALWCGVDIPENVEPGLYSATVSVESGEMPPSSFDLDLRVAPEIIEAHGDNEPWRHSRLRWLDSTIALDDEVVAPYTPVEVRGKTLGILGREVTLAKTGFPETIRSYFAPEMTRLTDQGRDVISAPVEIIVEDGTERVLTWRSQGPRIIKQEPGAVSWTSKNTAGPWTMQVYGEIELDGTLEYTVVVSSTATTTAKDIRLHLPVSGEVAKYMMGLGRRGGLRPRTYEWKWGVEKNQDGAWLGDVNAGLQFSLRDEHYARPLNTNFYQLKPLVMPGSWDNEGKGGCRLDEEGGGETFLVQCGSGPRNLRAGEKLHFDFRLLATPFRTVDTAKQWSTRFYHRFEPVEEIAKAGANTINVHHATDINPYINYPFFRPEEMKAYIDEAHARGMKVKIYYTVRELTNRAPEIFALRSLGEEIFFRGPGGGPSWLQEHLGSNYIAGWLVPHLKDAAVVNSGVSRWHNFYLEGLDWLVRNVGIDGLYIDDVAFDRNVMKRLRKILDRGREGALIDLHSANQYNERDGFAVSANLYLEHFPYLDRLWFGEYFDYDSPPDLWLVELSGIPFGLMGEMLQDGGNPWRGMLYGMTARMPWAGDPSPLWRFWDEVGIENTKMIGYWVPSSPVSTNHEKVLATTYLGERKTLLAIASWADGPVNVNLTLDWEALGIDPGSATLSARTIENFQEARVFDSDDAIPVEPGRGWLLIIESK